MLNHKPYLTQLDFGNGICINYFCKVFLTTNHTDNHRIRECDRLVKNDLLLFSDGFNFSHKLYTEKKQI